MAYVFLIYVCLYQNTFDERPFLNLKGAMSMINWLKERQIGDWCKRGAWIIAAFGLIEIVLGIYNTFQQAGLSGGVPLSLVFVSALQDALSIAATTLFYFLILYGAGLLANHFAATSEVAVLEVEEEKSGVVANQHEDTGAVDTAVVDASEEKEHEEVGGATGPAQ
jgi:hypothetical protein